MTTVFQNKFDGGHAEDIRTHNTDECEKSLNFDIFTNPHKLIPYADSIAETVSSGSMDEIELSDVDISLIGSNYILTASGYETGASTKIGFYTKSDITNGGVLNWSTQAVSASGAYVKNSGVIFQTKFYALALSGGVYTLFRYNSGGSVTSIGTVTTSSSFYVKPFVHPSDKKLYGVIGQSIFQYDGSTFNKTGAGISLVLPSDYECTGLTNYGDYLAIGMRSLRGNGNSYVYLWDRQLTLVDANTCIDFGEGNLLILENLNESLFAVIQPQNTLPTTFTYKLKIRSYSGGSVETIKSIILPSSNGVSAGLKVKNEEKLYFGLNNDDSLYVFGKNKTNRYVLAKHRYFFNGTTIGSAFQGLSMIGDIIWSGFTTVGGVYTLMRSKTLSHLGETATYASVSTYKTTINPAMPLADRYKNKQLEAVQVAFTGKNGGTIGLKYSVDGSTMTSLVSESTTAIEDTVSATAEYTDNLALLAGKEFQFQIESTGGVEIKEIRYRYSVINEVV
tara:strand:+ start:1076 stop:2593 length:1518 start_codon:yes stop_codon:yes gene_type:complete